MALEKTWHFDANRVHPQVGTALLISQWQIWYIAQALLGNVGGHSLGLWTVYYSCDKTTAGTAGDAVDRWGGAVFDASKIIRAANGSAHSWMVLKSPDFGGSDFYYLILDFVGAANTNFTVTVCKAAPTGGTTLTRPTSTQEATPTALGQVLNNATVSAQHIHSGLTSDGKQYYVMMSRDTGGLFQFGLSLNYLSNTRATDDFHMAILSSHDDVNGAFSMTSNASSGQSGRMVSRKTAATAQAGYGAIIPLTIAAGAYINFSTQINMFGDLVDSGQPDFPVWIASMTASSAGAYSFKGRVPDFAIGPESRSDGTYVPLGGPAELMLCGGMWVPTNTIPSL